MQAESLASLFDTDPGRLYELLPLGGAPSSSGPPLASTLPNSPSRACLVAHAINRAVVLKVVAYRMISNALIFARTCAMTSSGMAPFFPARRTFQSSDLT